MSLSVNYLLARSCIQQTDRFPGVRKARLNKFGRVCRHKRQEKLEKTENFNIRASNCSDKCCRDEGCQEHQKPKVVVSRQQVSMVSMMSLLNLGTNVASALAEAVDDTPIDLDTFRARIAEQPPLELTWEIYVGLFAGLAPFVIAAYEFGKRIIIQRQCEVCAGSGLVSRGRYKRKCPSCGGFLPWESWQQFLTSEAGNGGVVRIPKGQTSVIYDVKAAREASVAMKQEMDEEMAVEAENMMQEQLNKSEKAKKSELITVEKDN